MNIDFSLFNRIFYVNPFNLFSIFCIHEKINLDISTTSSKTLAVYIHLLTQILPDDKFLTGSVKQIELKNCSEGNIGEIR